MLKGWVSFCFCLLFLYSPAQKKNDFRLGTTEFLLNGEPFQIISGEIHPARIPKEYWRHRIRMVKAMGCNTIAAYFFWNYHETTAGIFDFKTGNRDLSHFIKICREEGMWVLARPGPYVCAEWDFGGLPSYLLKIPDIRIRCMDPRYMNAVKNYIARMATVLKPHLVTNGGPILMLQIENEYGSFGNDKTYMKTLKELWVKNGINIPFFTADGPTDFMLDAGTLPGVAVGLDSGSSEADFEKAKNNNPGVPVFSSETYPGWLTHWGEKWQRPDPNNLRKEVEFLLKNKKSFNFYVIHGGTNFGFTAGANAFNPTQYQPDVTSYDYDAPINESGKPTSKYFMLRDLIRQYVSYPVPEIPDPIKSVSIPAFQLQPVNSIWNMLPKPVRSPQPLTMEALGQDHGLVLYRTQLVGHKSGKLTIWEPHDYALVFLDGKFIDTVFRDGGKWTIDLPKSTGNNKNPVLEILVESMGRINFAQFMIDRKGITDRVSLNGMTLMDWEIFSLPLDAESITQAAKKWQRSGKEGTLFSGDFTLDQAADTYLDMSEFVKGVVYVNGYNLGRYWHIGPQQRLYCPGVFLKKGKNEVVVMDLHKKETASIRGETTLE